MLNKHVVAFEAYGAKAAQECCNNDIVPATTPAAVALHSGLWPPTVQFGVRWTARNQAATQPTAHNRTGTWLMSLVSFLDAVTRY
jgi:hypothetical protein